MIRFALMGWLLIAAIQLVKAGGETGGIGAKSSGLAHASTTTKDPFALFNNIAGISNTNNLHVITFYELPYSMPSINRIAAGLVFPYKNQYNGLSFYRYGNENYHEFRAGLGIAHKINKVSLGVKINYNEIAISEIPTKRNLIMEFGGINEFSKYLHVGAHIYNFNKVIAGRNDNSIPIIMKAGILILPTEFLTFAIEVEKRNYQKAYIKTGIEYAFQKVFFLRTGINSETFSMSFGGGFKYHKLSMDYAVNSHSYLGLTHSVSLLFTPAKQR